MKNALQNVCRGKFNKNRGNEFFKWLKYRESQYNIRFAIGEIEPVLENLLNALAKERLARIEKDLFPKGRK